MVRVARSILAARYRTVARADVLRHIGFRHAVKRRRLQRRYRTRVEGAAAKRAEQMWRDAARELGAEVDRISPVFLDFRLGTARTRVSHLATTPFTDLVSAELAADKVVAHGLLRKAGLPVPDHVAVGLGHTGPAAEFLTRTGTPVVVKPARGGGGIGVVGGVRTPRQLARALANAWRFHPTALVERQYVGDIYRLLVLDDVVLDAIRGSAPVLVGDGTSTIETLVFREFASRIADGSPGQKPLDVDLDVLVSLENAGLTLASVLPRGASVVIKSATNYGGRAGMQNARSKIGAPLEVAAISAATALGVRLAGVDLIVTDLEAPLAESGGCVLEVNPVPGLTHHYNIAEPTEARHVCVPILAALLGLEWRSHTT